jgi:glucokinase
MSAPVLYGDLSKYGQVTLALGRAGKAADTFERFPCDSLEQLEDSLATFLRRQDALELDAAAFSACGWEQAGGLSMPNHRFSISREWLKDVLRIKRLHLVNDCVAMAMSVEHGGGGDLVEIHPAQGDDHAVKALIAAGIGLGTAAIRRGAAVAGAFRPFVARMRHFVRRSGGRICGAGPIAGRQRRGRRRGRCGRGYPPGPRR